MALPSVPLLLDNVQTKSAQLLLAPLATEVYGVILYGELGRDAVGSGLDHQAQRIVTASNGIESLLKKLSNAAAAEYQEKLITGAYLLRECSKDLDVNRQSHVMEPENQRFVDDVISSAKKVLQQSFKMVLHADQLELSRIGSSLQALKQVTGRVSMVGTLDELVPAYKEFVEKLMMLLFLISKRVSELVCVSQRNNLQLALITLHKAADMVNAASQTYIKFKTSKEAQSNRDRAISQVLSIVEEIAVFLKAPSSSGVNVSSQQDIGTFVLQIDQILDLLSPSSILSEVEGFTTISSSLEVLVEAVLRHSLTVATLESSKASKHRMQITECCYQILQLKDQFVEQGKHTAANPLFQELRKEFELSLERVTQLFRDLEKNVNELLLCEIVITFSETSQPLERLLRMALNGNLKGGLLNSSLQPYVEEFKAHADRVYQVARFVSASSTDGTRISRIHTCLRALERLEPQILQSLYSYINKSSPVVLIESHTDRRGEGHRSRSEHEGQGDQLHQAFEREGRQPRLESEGEGHQPRFGFEGESHQPRFEGQGSSRMEGCVGFKDLTVLKTHWTNEVEALVELIDRMSDPHTFIDISYAQISLAASVCRSQVENDHVGDSSAGDTFDVHSFVTSIRLLTGLSQRLVPAASQIPRGSNGHDCVKIFSRVRAKILESIGSVKDAAQDVISFGNSTKSAGELGQAVDKLLADVSRVKLFPRGGEGELTYTDTTPEVKDELTVPRSHTTPVTHMKDVESGGCTPVDTLLRRTIGPRENPFLSFDLLQACDNGGQVPLIVKEPNMRPSTDRIDPALTAEVNKTVRTAAEGDVEQTSLQCVRLLQKTTACTDLSQRVSQCCRDLDKKGELQILSADLTSAGATLLDRLKSLSHQANGCHTEEKVTLTTLAQLSADVWACRVSEVKEICEDVLKGYMITAQKLAVREADRHLISDLSQREESAFVCHHSRAKELLNVARIALTDRLTTSELCPLTEIEEALCDHAAALLEGRRSSQKGDMVTVLGHDLEFVSLLWASRAYEASEMVQGMCRRAAENMSVCVLPYPHLLDLSAIIKEGREAESLLENIVERVAPGWANITESVSSAQQIITSLSLLSDQSDHPLTFKRAFLSVHLLQWCTRMARAYQLLDGVLKESTSESLINLEQAAARVWESSGTEKVLAETLYRRVTQTLHDSLKCLEQWAEGLEERVTGTLDVLFHLLETLGELRTTFTSAVGAAERLMANGAQGEFCRLRCHWTSQLLKVRLSVGNLTEISGHDWSISQALERLTGNSQDNLTAHIPLKGLASLPTREFLQGENSTLSGKNRPADLGGIAPGLLEVDEVDGSKRQETELKHAAWSLASAYGKRHFGPLTNAARGLAEEAEKWEDESNLFVRVAKEMSRSMYHMAEYAHMEGPISDKKELFQIAASIAEKGRQLHQFAVIVGKYCKNERSASDLLSHAHKIPTLTTQLSVIASRRNTAEAEEDYTTSKSLVQNATNLMKAVSQVLGAAEAASVQGFKIIHEGDIRHDLQNQEALVLATHWKRHLANHRRSYKGVTNSLGLQKVERSMKGPKLTEILKCR